MQLAYMQPATLPPDYLRRVYAGVLGKMIGVYLGRPIEGWTYEQVMEELGEIDDYIHEHFNVPLVVPDDDLSGTFTFVRALDDYGPSLDLTPAQIGRTWLNYLIEEKTVLWWGGMGNSTEHTAYLRLKAGIQPPRSGSIELNGQVVAEQVGSQIFIDGWGMVAPGDPELAAEFAGRAACVSHDGEAIYGAQVVAAMEAQAFVEPGIDRLIDTAISLIPTDSTIYRMIEDIREWHAAEPDWHRARRQLAARYGYDTYGGNCHMVPNHGLILFALLYGAGDFRRSLTIVNTAGWDTDCNSGNLGCLLGIKNGLEGLAGGPDWRGPVADRLYLPTADGGRAITDAVTETIHLANMGRALHGLPPLAPKNGARFHFELPGSVQGFTRAGTAAEDGAARIENVGGHSELGTRSLAIHLERPAPERVERIETATFIPSAALARAFEGTSYPLLASPTIYPGQRLHARVSADASNKGPVEVGLHVRRYNAQDVLEVMAGDMVPLSPGEAATLTWQLPETGGYPIASAGLQIQCSERTSATVYLDYLTWDGPPNTALNRPLERQQNRLDREGGPHMWRKAWVNGLDSDERFSSIDTWPEDYRLVQNEGRGLLMQGTREWMDYGLRARLTPHMCRAGGIAVRVQGMQRYYALLLDRKKIRLIKAFEGRDLILAESEGGWTSGRATDLRLRVEGNRLLAEVNGQRLLEAKDPDGLYAGGGIALIVEEGRIGCDHVEVRPTKA